MSVRTPNSESGAPQAAHEDGLLGKRLFASSSMAFLVLVSGAGIGLVAQLGTVRLIGAESFGLYAYVIAWTTVLGYISTFGFHVSLLRLLPTYQVESDWSKAGGVLRFAVSGTALAGTAVAALAAATAYAVHGTDSELGRALLIGAAAVPLLGLRLVSAAAVRAYGGIIPAMLPERILRDTLAFLFLAFAVLTGLATPNAVTAMSAALLSAVLLLWILRRFLVARVPRDITDAPRSYAPRTWLQPAVWLTLIMLADTLMSRAGILVLGSRGLPTEVAIFTVATSLSLIAALPRLSISTLFAPTVSALYARKDMDGLQSLVARSALLSLGGTLAVALPLILGAPIILPWFGETFLAARPVLTILILGQLAAAAAGPQQHLLTMTGRERVGSKLMIAAAISNVICAAIFYGPFGVIGVAVAAALSMIGWNVGMMWFLRRNLGLRPGLACAPTLLKDAWSPKPEKPASIAPGLPEGKP
ncbi:O-antigen/teichoic acid export membrane protein [Aliiruegeria haliotis]|uniref:O-antigen/teichoic acid export membrane protein n=1 Tax=Aliiruegeria haliotis TaxID=1280846 RepID=A0A2T0RVP9_9RHOB|nr:polysaccharide biosynthesis C-terminal domain-containing protein [Aliiruegeria haliotis]PRY25202.1 O-antigen/teichoic acid export membrane protein [Aliiruegeria haliotis]